MSLILNISILLKESVTKKAQFLLKFSVTKTFVCLKATLKCLITFTPKSCYDKSYLNYIIMTAYVYS